MTADTDIYHAAKLLIDQRGENAAAFAAGRANALLDEDDLDGSLTCTTNRGSSGVLRNLGRLSALSEDVM